MSIPFRQVHLDFHTSEFIPEVTLGSAEAYAETLDKARVNSITTFARGHHGWLYYPSKKFPDLVHPGLTNPNLLIEQIDACHAKGIRVPIYVTVQWDGRIMREHPEWLARGRDGEIAHTYTVQDPHFYDMICVNSGYRKFLFDQVQDLIDVIGIERVDGLFFDIVQVFPCYCEHCVKVMESQGMSGEEDALRFAETMINQFKREMSDFLWAQKRELTVFYNGSHIAPAIKKSLPAYSHLEIESLPSGGWGYDHFPVVSRYARTLGKDVIGMTGKFHTFWGDFHSVKNQVALEFECFSMLAQGCGCSTGDQLHPSMGLSPAGYDLIGSVYKQVEEKEPWCINAVPISEVGVLTLDEWRTEGGSGLSSSLVGAVRMLQELAIQFDLIDSESDFSKYSLLILPDKVPWISELEAKLVAYTEQGGAVIGSWQSVLQEGTESPLYGVTPQGQSPYDKEFILPVAAAEGTKKEVGKGLFPEPYVMYQGGMVTQPTSGKSLMPTQLPYFNRGGKKFCSHQHTPAAPNKLGHPAVVQHGRVLYFSHPIFKLYRKNGASWSKTLVKNGIELLLGSQLISHNGPSSLVTTLQWQEQEQRTVLHLLHYIPEKRTEDLFVIEDVIPLYNLEVELNLAGQFPRKPIQSIQLVPQGDTVDWRPQADGAVVCTIPHIHGHQMVEIR